MNAIPFPNLEDLDVKALQMMSYDDVEMRKFGTELSVERAHHATDPPATMLQALFVTAPELA